MEERCCVRPVVLAMGLWLLGPASAGAQATGAAQAGATPGLQGSAQTSAGQAPDVQGVREELERLRQELATMRDAYEQRIAALEQRITALGSPAEGATTAAAATPASVDTSPAPAPVAATGPASKMFNPDTSVIANFLGATGRNERSEQPSLQLSEAEVSFQAVVDPYARADIYLAAGPDGVEIEEGFATFTSLPAGLLLKAGKMRANFGKVNTLHTHALPTADRPLVTDNLVGGEEGLSDGGLSLSKLLPNSLLYLEAIGEVYGSHSASFASSKRSKLTYLGRARAYRDITEGTNLDLGASVAYGPGNLEGWTGPLFATDPGDLDKRLIGVDVSFHYRPLRRAIYRRLNLRSEFVWSRQDMPTGEPARAFGFYSLGELQFARRWYIGARADRSGRTFEPDIVDKGGSVFLTYWPSEFSQVRGQFRRTRYGDDVTANEVLFQLNFSIGAHGAHVF